MTKNELIEKIINLYNEQDDELFYETLADFIFANFKEIIPKGCEGNIECDEEIELKDVSCGICMKIKPGKEIMTLDYCSRFLVEVKDGMTYSDDFNHIYVNICNDCLVDIFIRRCDEVIKSRSSADFYREWILPYHYVIRGLRKILQGNDLFMKDELQIPAGYKKYEGFVDMYANPKGYIFYHGSKPDDWGGNETKQAILLIEER